VVLLFIGRAFLLVSEAEINQIPSVDRVKGSSRQETQN